MGGPTVLKEFTDDPVDPGGTVTLEFTLTHSEFAPGPATAIAFDDDLTFMTDLEATGLPLVGACNGTGTLSGTTLLSFSGGVLAPGESCMFSATLSVPLTAPAGPHTNTTSDVTATVDGFAVGSGAARQPWGSR